MYTITPYTTPFQYKRTRQNLNSLVYMLGTKTEHVFTVQFIHRITYKYATWNFNKIVASAI